MLQVREFTSVSQRDTFSGRALSVVWSIVSGEARAGLRRRHLMATCYLLAICESHCRVRLAKFCPTHVQFIGVSVTPDSGSM